MICDKNDYKNSQILGFEAIFVTDHWDDLHL